MPVIITEFDEQKRRIVVKSGGHTLNSVPSGTGDFDDHAGAARTQAVKWGAGQWLGDWIAPATVAWIRVDGREPSFETPEFGEQP